MAFDIKVTQAKSAADGMDEIIQKMGSYQLELIGICAKLGILGDNTLHTYIKSIKDEIAHTYRCQCEMKNLQSALGSVIYEYVKTENSIKAEAEQAFIQPLDERGENPLSQVTDQEMDQAIADFEKNHADEIKDLNKFLNSGDSDDLTEVDIRHIKYLIYTAPELYRNIYLKNIDKFKIDTTSDDEGDAYYQPWKHKVTYAYPDCFANDPRGPYTVFFHECGHGIEDLADVRKWLGSDTEKYKFNSEVLGDNTSLREAILYDVYDNKDNIHSVRSVSALIAESGISGSKGDVDNVIKAMKNGDVSYLKGKEDHRLYAKVKEEITKGIGNVTYEAITDVYGGVSNNELCGGGYGHSNDYWKDDSKVAKELWAEYFSYNMAGNTESLKLVYEYFPESAKGLDAYANTLGE